MTINFFKIKTINFQLLQKAIIAYHLLFFFIAYYVISLHVGANDGKYFLHLAKNAHTWASLFGFGTKFMAFLIYPLVKIGFNYFFLSLICALISLKGFLIYFDLLKNKNFNYRFLVFFWLFLPSLHYWTCFLGKDAVVFLTMAVVVRSIERKKFKSILLVILLILSFFIRPYSVIILILVGLIILLFFTNCSLKKKMISFFTVVFLGVISFPFIIKKFLKIKEYDGFVDLISKFYNSIQVFNSSKGSHFFDLYKTSYLEKLSVLLARPLFFNAKSVFQYIASVQNSIIIISICAFLYLFFIKKKRLTKLSHKFALLVFVFFSLIISTYIFNLGQASRMRVMILPYLFFALSSFCLKEKSTLT